LVGAYIDGREQLQRSSGSSRYNVANSFGSCFFGGTRQRNISHCGRSRRRRLRTRGNSYGFCSPWRGDIVAGTAVIAAWKKNQSNHPIEEIACLSANKTSRLGRACSRTRQRWSRQKNDAGTAQPYLYM